MTGGNGHPPGGIPGMKTKKRNGKGGVTKGMGGRTNGMMGQAKATGKTKATGMMTGKTGLSQVKSQHKG